jgi:hypothetical protein
MTYSAESLRSSIKNHNHYGPCLNGSRYSYFCSKSNELDTYIDIDSKGYRLKEEIIKENNELKIKEKDSSLSREEVNREYDNIKDELEYEEKNEKNYYEKRLKNLEEQKKNEENNALNEIKELEKDIKNLKEIIEELRKKDVEEEDWNREKILNELILNWSDPIKWKNFLIFFVAYQTFMVLLLLFLILFTLFNFLIILFTLFSSIINWNKKFFSEIT